MRSNSHRTPLWIVIADAVVGRIYACRAGIAPLLVEELNHPRAHVRDRDLASDRPGRSSSDFGGSHSFAPEANAADVERDRFARSLAQVINGALDHHRFDELALVMAPELLGLVRLHLSKGALGAVVAALDSRLNDIPVEDVVRRVADARMDARA